MMLTAKEAGIAESEMGSVALLMVDLARGKHDNPLFIVDLPVIVPQGMHDAFEEVTCAKQLTP
jgi:hypothetical protein